MISCDVFAANLSLYHTLRIKSLALICSRTLPLSISQSLSLPLSPSFFIYFYPSPSLSISLSAWFRYLTPSISLYVPDFYHTLELNISGGLKIIV